ncbi:MAG TPA: cysteine desulfurase family protein [Kineosporiaceae bacterium]|nr:cysteine desulfurase family protein [Kineosporiaceae bacterium]
MIYLDYNATTPVDPRVLAAMLPLFTEEFANPASTHGSGRAVADRVESARRQVTEAVGAPGHGVVFTGGATEAANLGVRGLLGGLVPTPGRSRVLVGAGEHKAVLEACRVATAGGRGLPAVVRVNRDGSLNLDHLRALLDSDVALVVVMAANNETGALNDLRTISRLAHDAGALVLSDVTQAVGKVRLALDDWKVDLAVLSGHKIYGPKGVGAVVARRDVLTRLTPVVVGGSQERGVRPGTLNTPGIVGLGAAAELAAARLRADARRLTRLRRLLYDLLVQRLPAVGVNGPVNADGRPRGGLPNTLNLRFAGAPADAVLTCLPEVAVSAGSACDSGSDEPSHVLLATGLSRTEALESLRFSLGRPTTETEVRRAAEQVAAAVEHVRGLRGAMARWRDVSSRQSDSGRTGRGDRRGTVAPW